MIHLKHRGKTTLRTFEDIISHCPVSPQKGPSKQNKGTWDHVRDMSGTSATKGQSIGHVVLYPMFMLALGEDIGDIEHI